MPARRVPRQQNATHVPNLCLTTAHAVRRADAVGAAGPCRPRYISQDLFPVESLSNKAAFTQWAIDTGILQDFEYVFLRSEGAETCEGVQNTQKQTLPGYARGDTLRIHVGIFSELGFPEPRMRHWTAHMSVAAAAAWPWCGVRDPGHDCRCPKARLQP